MKATHIALILTLCTHAAHARTYHVSTTGLDTNPGTRSQPFKTISAAAQVAQAGDVVTVLAGVYRERVNPPRGGTSEDNRIVYQAAPGQAVEIKGSERIKGWEQVQAGVWKVTLPNRFFGDFNPYNDLIGGEWYNTPRDRFNRHTGAVYSNGEWLDESPTLENVFATTHDRALWYATVDQDSTTIWAQFKDVNPNTERVEINVRQSIFYPDQPGRNYITVRGFALRHAATPWSGAMSEQIGLIGTHWSKGWVIENNLISHSMNTGITLGRYNLGALGIAMPPATAPGFVKSVELALEHGWSKEKIGSHVVRNNHISHCEKNGIHGSLGGIFSTIEGNTICDIAQRGWISGPDVAGLKLLASHDTLIKDNHIYRCAAVGGIWLDWMAQGTRCTGNLLHDNSQDLFVEVNHGPFVVDNNIFLSSRGVLESCGGGAYVHNLFNGQLRLRVEKDRETPFHRAHSTAMLGLSRVIGDDERYHNNLFAGNRGLSVYDAWAPANLQAVGNVYLSGSKPSVRDQHALTLAQIDPQFTLQEMTDGWWLEMVVDSAWTSSQERSIVTTGALGRARVPDAPFKQPDGKPYRFDTDYYGLQRNTERPAPGPIEWSKETAGRVKVWPKR